MSNVQRVIENLFYFNKQDSANILQILGNYMFKKPPVTCSELPIQEKSPFSFVAPSISSGLSHYNDIGYDVTLDEPFPVLSEPEVSIDSPVLVPVQESVPLQSHQIEYLSPTHQDTLFWCIYIAVFGYDDYLQVSRNYGVKELEVKQKVGNWIQKNPGKMKEANIKITKVAIQEILSELLTSVKETSIISMVGMIVFFKINVILVDSTGALMLEFKASKDNDSYPTIVLYKDTFGKYKLRADSLNHEQAVEFKQTMVCLESHLKPLKPLSTYHIDDLKNIARRLGGFDETYKYKKNELYDELNESMKWK
jgi:hypothetical protein